MFARENICATEQLTKMTQVSSAWNWSYTLQCVHYTDSGRHFSTLHVVLL